LAADELRQVALLQVVGAVGGDRLHRSLGQEGADAERGTGAVPQLLHGEAERDWQSLAAVLGAAGERAPAGFDPAGVGLATSARRRYLAVREAVALDVAGPVERRHHLGGEPARLVEHRIDYVAGKVGKHAAVNEVAEARDLVEGMAQVVGMGSKAHRAIRLLDSEREAS